MIAGFADIVRAGGFVVTVQCAPPRGVNADRTMACADILVEMVNAIQLTECEDGVRMSALAACGQLISAGAEPVLQVLTRDMNRIALQAQLLGTAAIGVKSVLCTSGRHQALTSSRSAKGVFDVDPIQLLQIADEMRKNGVLADGQPIEGKVDFVLGAETNPFAEPIELQIMIMAKAIAAGADFIVTQPVFSIPEFERWMSMVRDRKLHDRTCIIASVAPITSSQDASDAGADELAQRLGSASDPRAEGVRFAVEIAGKLKEIDGVRGICVVTGEDCTLAKDVLSASGVSGS